MTSLEGSTLKGKYQLEELLGSGGMGEVYRARNVLVDRTVAIKVLRAEFAENVQVVERFMREAKAANVVRHRHIVDVLDIDKTDDGVMFIVQEYLEGEDLAARLTTARGGLSSEEALDLLIPVVEAVGAAHASGVVHRDLKPDNVFLAVDGDDVVPKVLDFGISKLPVQDNMRRTALGVGEAPKGVRLTAVGAAMGTPLYMSPEQIKDPASVDPRGDVWSLGVMLYETLSGQVPFMAEDLAGLFAEICTREATPLGRLAPDVPADLAQVIHRCLRAERDERYADATTLAERLRQCRLKLGDRAAARRGHRPAAPTVVSTPPPPQPRSLGHEATVPDAGAAAALAAPGKSAGAAASQDWGLELDLPVQPAPSAPSRGSGGGQAAAADSARAAVASGAAQSSQPRGQVSQTDGAAGFGLFDDDEVAALDLQLDDGGESFPSSPHVEGRPRAAVSTSSSSAAGADSGRARRPAGRARVRLTGKVVGPSPSKLGEVVRATVAVVLSAALAVLAPHGAPVALSAAHLAMGAAAHWSLAAAAGVMLAVVVWLVRYAARWGSASLFVTALAALLLAAACAVVAVVLGAPGIVGGTVRMVAVFALPWAAIAVALGLGVYGGGRALELLRRRGARWLGGVFAVSAALCVAAAFWMFRLPLPTVAGVQQLQLVPAEAEAREGIRRLSVTWSGARAMRRGGPPLQAPLPRSGGAAAAALTRAAPPR